MSNIKNHVLVNGIKIGKAIVVSNDLLEKGSCIPGSKINPTSITFHQTDCIDVDAPRMHLALTNANNDKYAGTSKSNYRLASWHITVGYDKIIQNCPFNWKAYAQGCKTGNNTSISIEMCMYNDKEKTYQTYLNAIALYKLLIKEYKSSLIAKAHYDWTKKNCPSWLRGDKFGYSWSWFKGELTKKTIAETTTSTEKAWKNGDYNCKVKATTNLNARKGRGTNNPIIYTIPKGTEFTVGYVYNNWVSTWDFKGQVLYICCDYIEKV